MSGETAVTSEGLIADFKPVSGDLEGENGNTYYYAYHSRADGIINLTYNGTTREHILISEAPTEFQELLATYEAERVNLKLLRHVRGGLAVSGDDEKQYLRAWRLLHAPNNDFLKYCVALIGDYHALDVELVQTLLLGATRARYPSASALAHFDCTGASGAGKNDLVDKFSALIPSSYVDKYSSISPTALYYETVERHEDEKGRPYYVANRERFKGKIVIITEVADSAGFTALKALGETEEAAENTHMATVNGRALKMIIHGARCVIITSVEGITDTQIKRRFIHSSISDDTEDNKKDKLEVAHRIMIDDSDIYDDERLPSARAGIDLIFSTDGVVFEPIQIEAEELILKLEDEFITAGYGITNIKQFFTLCQCSALWNRFARGVARIEVNDVRAAWFLLSTFEKETISKTTRGGLAVLKAIKELNDEYEAKYEDETLEFDTDTKSGRPTRADIVKRSKLPHATVYRLLGTRENERGQLGELLELGYVLMEYADGKTVIELSDTGRAVLRDVPRKVEVDGVPYTPLEPRAFGNPHVIAPAKLTDIVKIYETERV